MNKVRFPLMYSVVMALVAKCLTVAYVVAQIGSITNWHYVMRFKTAIASAYLASVIITLQYGRLPRQIFWAASTLRLSVAFSFRYGLTVPTAINVFAQTCARSIDKSLTASFAGKNNTLLSALNRTIDSATNMRWRTSDGLTACFASDIFLL